MIEVIQSDVFKAWWEALRNPDARFRIDVRIRRRMTGNLGDVKPVGVGISEARVDVGSGYRLYFIRRGTKVIVLLCGGDKSSQTRDIAKAKRLAKELG